MERRSAAPPPSAFEALHIECEERDNRLLEGGNFFGTETVAPPLRPPLPEKEPPAESAAPSNANR